ncbi:MAG: NAD(P)H-hydrate dehydratase [Alphaproteobacteria bacterium]|nr:NAD(P)H-hydrate dehydratase [Alphaproteobacteria bacterium]
MAPFVPGPEVLTVAQHAQADRLAAAAGISSLRLMEAAGQGVADAIRQRFAARPTVVLCGPGNNGGDGFVVARVLRDAAWPVRVAALGESKGDAAAVRTKWDGSAEAVSPAALDGAELVVDALFGAGLSRPLDGAAAAIGRAVTERGLDCVAVDVPSGVTGDTGALSGPYARAALTVTFFRKKPAHLLYPARQFCGDIVVADIGIPASVLADIEVTTFENGPALWSLPEPSATTHKYGRGHVLVMSGGVASTGAARLAAESALRAGAGLVTLAGPPEAIPIHAEHVTEVLLKSVANPDALAAALKARRRNVAIVGPGNGVGESTAENVLTALRSGVACVLDADALTSFAGKRETLLAQLRPDCVLTPHDGEFGRLFPAAANLGDRLLQARAAAAEANAVIARKGPDTVVAHPGGRAAINANAPATLATAGSGDVLAGFIGGLLAQGMTAFDAAAAAVWLHGEAARQFGPGLIASDLHRTLPSVLRSIRSPA